MAVINRTPDSFYDRGATFALEQRCHGGSGCGGGRRRLGRHRRRPVRSRPRRSRCRRRSTGSCRWSRRSSRRRTSSSRSTPTRRRSRARRSPPVRRSSTTRAACATRRWRASSRRPTRRWCSPTASGRRAPRSPRRSYDDVVAEVIAFLQERVARAEAAGVSRERLIVDPGHDLDKNTLHSLEITRRFDELGLLGLPLLAAVSNKDFIGESLDRPQGERLEGSIAAMVVCILKGARIVRMHDVRQSVAAVRMTEAILGFRDPVRARAQHAPDPQRVSMDSDHPHRPALARPGREPDRRRPDRGRRLARRARSTSSRASTALRPATACRAGSPVPPTGGASNCCAGSPMSSWSGRARCATRATTRCACRMRRVPGAWRTVARSIRCSRS